MTSVVQDIQAVRALRNDLTVEREVNLPSNILNSIEAIHNCIKSGTDLNGWKRVDWRNGGVNTSNSRSYSHVPVRNGSNYGQGHSRDRGDNGTFFNDRQESSSHHAFGNRNKSGVNSRHSEPPTSIPLTSGVAPSTPTVSTDGFRCAPHKYISMFKKSSEKVEDTILNTIILGKLNKFSEKNYEEIKEFITHIIDNGQTDMIKCFMKLVFEKAASEEMFCPLYARLLSELSIRYPVLLTEMANLYTVYMSIFEEVSGTKAENYNDVCKQNVEKKYRRGYSQFLAELIKHSVIDTDIFMMTITTIITQVQYNLKTKEATKLNEEYADCLVKIMKAIQEDNTDEHTSDNEVKENMIEKIRQSLKGKQMECIKELTVRHPENIGLSNKARFTFLDIYEGIQKF
jgi:hypothetical protein